MRLYPLVLALSTTLVTGCGLTLGQAQASSTIGDIQRDVESSVEFTPPTEHIVPATPTDPSEWLTARKRGVSWLKSVQHSDGGWSSGAWGTDGMQAASDVATTAFVVLALYRDGGDVTSHQTAITKGVHFVLNAVESAPSGPRLATPTGTQIQYKLGETVDTHLTALMLGELSGTLDPTTNARVNVAHDTVIGKVQQAQRNDGSFDGNGWAPLLSSSVASQALYRAAELGKDVDMEVLKKSEEYQTGNYQAGSGFDTTAGAGVELYSVASTLRSNAQSKQRKMAAGLDASTWTNDEAAEQAATQAVATDDGSLMAGFGSIGGEEMLSYMMITDTLHEEGGSSWTTWEARIGTYLSGIQNPDGSWVGHHCITSRTFTTAGAIMTLAAGNV